MLTALLIFVVASVSYAQLSIIPLSASDYAYAKGNAASNVLVEFYIDLACSETMDAWPLINEVTDTYTSDVLFRFHVFPLPYHQQAFLLSKAAETVDFLGDSSTSVFTYMDTVFANQDQIYTSSTADMTYNQVVDLIMPWATNGTGVTETEYYDGMDQNSEVGSQIFAATRYMWKYATLNEISGTPMYVINGVKVMGLETFAQWQAVLDPLLAAAKARASRGL